MTLLEYCGNVCPVMNISHTMHFVAVQPDSWVAAAILPVNTVRAEKGNRQR